MQDFATMGPPSGQTLWRSMRRKADATCQADGVEAGHSGDGDVDATTRKPGDGNDDATNGDTCVPTMGLAAKAVQKCRERLV